MISPKLCYNYNKGNAKWKGCHENKGIRDKDSFFRVGMRGLSKYLIRKCKKKNKRGTTCFKVYRNSQTLSIPLTQENIWNDLLMGHHLPPSFSYILHRKNTGRCPLYLDARKFNQCNWHVYFSTDTGNNYQAFISKTLLAFPIRFCDKVTSWGNILYRTNGIMSK